MKWDGMGSSNESLFFIVGKGSGRRAEVNER